MRGDDKRHRSGKFFHSGAKGTLAASDGDSGLPAMTEQGLVPSSIRVPVQAAVAPCTLAPIQGRTKTVVQSGVQQAPSVVHSDQH